MKVCGFINRKASITTLPLTDWIGSTTTATALGGGGIQDRAHTEYVDLVRFAAERDIEVSSLQNLVSEIDLSRLERFEDCPASSASYPCNPHQDTPDGRRDGTQTPPWRGVWSLHSPLRLAHCSAWPEPLPFPGTVVSPAHHHLAQASCASFLLRALALERPIHPTRPPQRLCPRHDACRFRRPTIVQQIDICIGRKLRGKRW